MIYTSGKIYDQTSFREQTKCHTEVIKYGSKTEYTRGLFDVEGLCVKRFDLDGQSQKLGCVLNNQLLVLSAGSPDVKPFAAEGDSGSLLFAKHGGKWYDLRAVGIIEGGTTNKLTVVTPIWDICRHLGINIEHGFKQFTLPLILRNESGYISPGGLLPSLPETAGRDDDIAQQRIQERQSQDSEMKEIEGRINARLDNMQKEQTEHFQAQISDIKRQQEEHVKAMNEQVQQKLEAMNKNIDDKMDTMMKTMQQMMPNMNK